MPTGNPEGGRWTTEGGGGAFDTVGDRARTYVGVGGGARTNVRVAEGVTGFAGHGTNQAITRGVSPSSILDAVRNPLRVVPRSNGTTQYRGAGATVVPGPNDAVITVWPKSDGCMSESPDLIMQIRNILLNVWDQIGVRDVPQAHDEYDIYTRSVLSVLRDGADTAHLQRLLSQITEEEIGLPASAGRSLETAKQLCTLVRR